MDKQPQPWIFPFLVGVLVGLVVGYWPKIASAWSSRQKISGATKIAEGLEEIGL